MNSKTREKLRRAGLARFAVYVAMLELIVTTQKAAKATEKLGEALLASKPKSRKSPINS